MIVQFENISTEKPKYLYDNNQPHIKPIQTESKVGFRIPFFFIHLSFTVQLVLLHYTLLNENGNNVFGMTMLRTLFFYLNK